MSSPAQTPLRDHSDVLLIGSGIMSANLGAMLKRLAPSLSIQLVEHTDALAQESSNGWNNAGTGHAAICELSYTPERDLTGKVPIGRALHIFEQFEHSKQFWANAVKSGMTAPPESFIQAMPHICFVEGPHDVDFLKDRHAAMEQHHFFRGIELTTDRKKIEQWAPLIIEGRAPTPLAATHGIGTEVNFGQLARQLCTWLGQQDSCAVTTGWTVTSLQREHNTWRATLRCCGTGETRSIRAGFVFVGAGGGSLPLLQSTHLPEVAGLGAFPVGGQWLVCDHASLASRHNAKVYGVPDPAAPHVGTPHLDQRRLDGKCQLLFGPFAAWTTRFLKNSGHWLDLLRSVRPDNITAMLRAGIRNAPMLRYLVTQGLQTMDNRMVSVRKYYPDARAEDWRLIDAGIRVQTIKRSDRGAVYFGTEVFTSNDRSLAALLGASPGASVSANIALDVIKTCLPQLLADTLGCERMRSIIPTFDQDLKRPSNAGLFEKTTREAEHLLNLTANRNG